MRCRLLTFAIDDPGHLSVCKCVSPLSRGFTRRRCANAAKRIEVLLGVDTLVDPLKRINYFGHLL